MKHAHNLNITISAYTKIHELMQNNNTLGLRISIVGGGCSGFSYTFSLVDEINKDDIIINKDDINIIVDPMSIMYLDNATIKYEKEIMQEQFVIDNPAAKQTCGCGQSFTV